MTLFLNRVIGMLPPEYDKLLQHACSYHLTSLQLFIVIPYFCLCIPSLTFHCLYSVVSSSLCFISLPASDFCSYFTDDGCCIASETFDSGQFLLPG